MKHKTAKYARIESQIKELIEKINNPLSRMATITAILHHKIKINYWTGFYLLNESELEVACYQGPLACMRLKKNTGVCWTSINMGKSIVVGNVDEFPGHIACSSFSKSEIVIPVWDGSTIKGCLDIDSRELSAYNAEDAKCLESIVAMIYD